VGRVLPRICRSSSLSVSGTPLEQMTALKEQVFAMKVDESVQI